MSTDTPAQPGAVWLNGALVCCEAMDREPCPHQPERRCATCPGAAAVPQPAQEPITVEAVAEVVKRGDELDLPWLIEGGICALTEGVVLLVASKPITDDEGSGEVYAAPTQASGELVEALNNLLEAVESMQGTYGCVRGDTPEDADTFTHDEWAEKFLQERANAAVAALSRASGAHNALVTGSQRDA